MFEYKKKTELLSAELPDEYEKESWQLDDTEKLSTINRLRNEGNDAYKAKDYEHAEQRYRTALGMVEQLILKYNNLYKNYKFFQIN